MAKLMFVSYRPTSSADYTPQLFCEDETYHWKEVSWGEGFETQVAAEEDFWKSHEEDEDELPEILTIGSEYDGLLESLNDGTVALDSEDYAKLCLEEAEDELGSDFVLFESCPRGFANEMGFVAVSAAAAADYRREDGYSEISREDFITECARGGENYAEDNSPNNPPCGSFGLEIVSENEEAEQEAV